jgi:hypothetical protein
MSFGQPIGPVSHRLAGSTGGGTMGRKRTGPGPNAPERNREFAAHLLALMQEAGLTAPEVASRMGRSRSEVYQYLVGQHLPRLEILPELAKALNLDTARSLLPEGW